MDDRRVRYGLMLPKNQFIELLSIKRSKDGFVLWVPNSGRHITIINEELALSSHKTDEITDKKEHIGRLSKSLTTNDEEFIEKMFHPRLLEPHEYSKPVIFLSSEMISFFTNKSYEMKVKETHKEIIYYFDLQEIFETVTSFIERFRENPYQLAWVGTAQDVLQDELGFAVTEDQKIIVSADDGLYELDSAPMDIFEPGNPLAEFFHPLGFSELLPDFQRTFREIPDRKDNRT